MNNSRIGYIVQPSSHSPIEVKYLLKVSATLSSSKTSKLIVYQKLEPKISMIDGRRTPKDSISSSFAIFNDIKTLKKAELLLGNYPKEFVKMAELAIGTTEHQKLSNLKIRSL
jgi:hypothetical protein